MPWFDKYFYLWLMYILIDIQTFLWENILLRNTIIKLRYMYIDYALVHKILYFVNISFIRHYELLTVLFCQIHIRCVDLCCFFLNSFLAILVFFRNG